MLYAQIGFNIIWFRIIFYIEIESVFRFRGNSGFDKDIYATHVRCLNMIESAFVFTATEDKSSTHAMRTKLLQLL